VEYKSDLRRNGNDYLSKNAEQEVSVKLGLDYQKDDTRLLIPKIICKKKGCLHKQTHSYDTQN
jgi:hypothetical protein